jgi:hypothetical protein
MGGKAPLLSRSKRMDPQVRCASCARQSGVSRPHRPVERYFQRGLQREFGEWHSWRCPEALGIDEHFFSRRKNR